MTEKNADLATFGGEDVTGNEGANGYAGNEDHQHPMNFEASKLDQTLKATPEGIQEEDRIEREDY